MFKAANPFMDQAPYKILTRQYKVGEFTITSAFTSQQYNFPQALLVLPAIEKALSSFYYFRSDVEIAVKINSTPYHQGLLQSSFYHDQTYDGAMTLVQRSALNAVYYNYSSSDSATMTFGWLHPQIYMKLVSPPTAENYIGTLTFMPVIPIANTSGGGASITVTVYARFVNPKTAGFRSQPPTVQGQASQIKKFNFKPESEDKSERHVQTSDETDNLLSPLFKPLNLVEGVATNVLDLFAKLTKILDKPLDISTPQRMQYSLGSDHIQGDGLQFGDRLSLYPTSKLASFKDGCLDSSYPVVAIAQQPMLYDVFNFTPSATVYDFYAHPMNLSTLNYTTYDTDGRIGQPDYLSYITGMHRFWKGSIKYLLYFVTNAFTTARFRISYIIDYDENTLSYGGDFPSQIVDIKGSTITKFTVPYLWQTPYRVVLPPQITPGQPYQSTPKITVECLSLPIASQGEDPIISLAIWRAAGEDYQLASPCVQQINPFAMVGETSVFGQTSMQAEFKFTFAPISCQCRMFVEQGFTTTETVGKVNDVMKRFATDFATEGSILQMRPKTFEANPNTQKFNIGPHADVDDIFLLQPYSQYLQLFKYQRGSVRYRYLDISTNTDPVYITPSSLGGTSDIGSGQIIWTTKMNPVQTVEVPWIATVPCYPTDSGPSIIIPINMSVVTFDVSELPEGDVTVFVANGDDRLYTYLLPPPKFDYLPTPPPKVELKNSNSSKPTVAPSVIPKSKGKASFPQRRLKE